METNTDVHFSSEPGSMQAENSLGYAKHLQLHEALKEILELVRDFEEEGLTQTLPMR